MEQTTRKIVFACAIGGAAVAVFCVLAGYIFSTHVWWLGTIPGFMVGYLAYEFSEMPKAVRRAWRVGFKKLKTNTIKLTTWLKSEPRALAFTAEVILWSLIIRGAYLCACQEAQESGGTISMIWGIIIVMSVYMMGASLAIAGIIARLGARTERQYCMKLLDKIELSAQDRYGWYDYKEAPLTYSNYFRWILRGCGICLRSILQFLFLSVPLFLLWKLWVFLWVHVVWEAIKFPWRMVKFVHCRKRLLCGVDSVLGGSVAYLIATSSRFGLVFSAPQLAFVILLGSCLGALIGVFSWKFISQKYFHANSLAPTTNGG